MDNHQKQRSKSVEMVWKQSADKEKRTTRKIYEKTKRKGEENMDEGVEKSIGNEEH